MPTSQDIASKLEHQIIFGRLHPSQRLVEDDLMQQFTATRHQVRKALEVLVREGVAIKVRNKGVQVRSFSVKDTEELYELRHILQTAAIRRMPLPCTQEAVNNMQSLCEDHIAATTPQQLLWRNNLFHEYFFALCGNQMLADEIAAHTRATHPIRSRGFFDDAYLEIVRSEHQEIVDALRTCDRARLAQLNTQHIERPKKLYLATQAILEAQ